MKGIVIERFNTMLFESELDKALGDNNGAKQFAREFRAALTELDQAINDQFILTEAQQKRLTVDQLQMIFKNASQISMGKNVAAGPEDKKTSMLKDIMSKGIGAAKDMGGKIGASLGKLNAVMDKAITSVEGKGPIGDFNKQFEEKKAAFVEKNPKVGKALDKLKQIGEKYPKATPIIIGGLVALGTFAGAPLLSMGIGLLAKTAVNVAKGEAATSALGKAVKAPLIGGVAGEIASGAVDAITGGSEAATGGAEGASAAASATDVGDLQFSNMKEMIKYYNDNPAEYAKDVEAAGSPEQLMQSLNDKGVEDMYGGKRSIMAKVIDQKLPDLDEINAKGGAEAGAGGGAKDPVIDKGTNVKSGGPGDQVADVNSQVNSKELEQQERQSLAQQYPTNDDFVQSQAEDIFFKMAEKNPQFSGVVDSETVEKIKANIKVSGDVSTGDIQTKFTGKFVMGRYLAPDELPELQKIISNNGGGMSGITSDEARAYLDKVAPVSKDSFPAPKPSSNTSGEDVDF